MRLFIFIVLCLISLGCDTFIPDPIDHRLPIFSDSGNQVAGAYINDEIWVSRASFSDDPRLIVINPEGTDSLVLCLFGRVEKQRRIIQFELTDVGIRNYDDLLNLHERKISLDGTNDKGVVFQDTDFLLTDNGIGQLYFKHVKRSGSGNIIISGTFGFIGDDGTEVFSGRFDFTVNELRRWK